MTLPSRLLFSEALLRQLAQVLYRCFEEGGSTKAALYLRLPGEAGYGLAGHYGWPRTAAPPEALAAEDPLALWALRERRSFVVNTQGQTPELLPFSQGSETPRFLVTPLFDQDEAFGLLLQRDRVRREPFDLERDAPLAQAIGMEVADILRDYRQLGGASEPEAAPAEAPPQVLPVAVPPSGSLVPAGAPEGELLERLQATLGGSVALAPVEDAAGTASRARSGSPERPRVGSFLPEQRVFFWEAASLLSSVVSLGALALWSEEPQEIRPILAYSRYPLGSDLKQQILASAAFHIPEAKEGELRLLTRAEFLEQEPLSGLFRTYIPVLLEQEGGGHDLMLLFRQEDRPFSEREQAFIRQVARLLGFHLQEARLHAQYHRAFLSVSHRLLTVAEGVRPELRPHSLNTARLARAFAARLDLPSAEVEAVSIAAILHDVGTLLLDPALLAKPELDASDLARVRTHPVLASTFLKDYRFPFDVLGIIRHHHERWDGGGYPDGLKGEAIPMGSRIIALVEAFEVMSSGSGYRDPRALQDVVAEIRREAGAQFDPALAAAFVEYLLSRSRG